MIADCNTSRMETPHSPEVLISVDILGFFNLKDKMQMAVELYQFITIVSAPALAILGFLLRRACMKLDQTMTEEEVRMLIKDKIDPIQVHLVYIQRDLTRLADTNAKILEFLRNGQTDDSKFH